MFALKVAGFFGMIMQRSMELTKSYWILDSFLRCLVADLKVGSRLKHYTLSKQLIHGDFCFFVLLPFKYYAWFSVLSRCLVLPCTMYSMLESTLTSSSSSSIPEHFPAHPKVTLFSASQSHHKIYKHGRL